MAGDRDIVSLSKSPRRMPPNWRPVAPAWSSAFADQHTPIVMAYFGTQSHGADATRSDQFARFFDSPDGPSIVERSQFPDRTGAGNHLCAAYWTNLATYEKWETSSGFRSWWNDPARLNDQEGYFREIMTVPLDRFETIFSLGAAFGFAKAASSVVGPIREHSYWGSMRDRLMCSSNDDLVSTYGDRLKRSAPSTRGRGLRVEVPGNLAVIRSGQDWSECTGAELSDYIDSVRPALTKGMNFLRDNPEETGCCDLRFAEELEADGSPTKRTFGFGLFLTLEHLEKWAATHPTHLQIFGTFGKMVQRYGASLKLKLWHEVSVLPAEGQTFEYLNCHPDTGLLPYFQSRSF